MKSTKPHYQLFEKKVQDRIKSLMSEVRSQVQWLDDYCMTAIYESEPESFLDLSLLVDIATRLERIANVLGEESCLMVDFSDCSLHLWATDHEYPEEVRKEIEELAEQN